MKLTIKLSICITNIIVLGLCANTFAQQVPTTKTIPQPPSERYNSGLGRLLTTEIERAKIDDLRFNVKPPEPPKIVQEVGPPQLQLDGISVRPDRPLGQRVTVWIDGRAYPENALPIGLSIVKNSSGEVMGINSKIGKGKTEFAKIGTLITRPQTADEAKALEQGAADASKAVK